VRYISNLLGIATTKMQTQAPNPALLDHIIVLLPHEDLQNPPAWLADNFSLTDGGRHADGKTENKLIVRHESSKRYLVTQ
jgi:hypothetical protein